MTETQLDRKDLKVQALVEKIAYLTAQYENQLADARVEITFAEEAINSLRARITELEAPDEGVQEEDVLTDDAD